MTQRKKEMNNQSNYEIRTLAQPPMVTEGRTIAGYAIVWDVESRVLWNYDGEFVEIISRGAVDEALLGRSDVKALYNHHADALLARWTNGEGTLRLSVDEHGLRYEFDAPETTTGNDVLELVRRGDLKGSSFAFRANSEDVDYSTTEDGRKLRTVRKLSGLYDVSVVVDPAYTQTSVSARSFEALEPRRSLADCKKRLEKMYHSINPKP